MTINFDLCSDVLDLATFFLVTPGLIGEQRLNEFGRSLERRIERFRPASYSDLYFNLVLVLYAGAMLLFSLASVVLIHVFLSREFGISFLYNDSDRVGLVLDIFNHSIFAVTFISAVFGAGVITVYALFLEGSIKLLTRFPFVGEMLFIGTGAFLVSRAIQIANHLHYL